MPLYVTVPDRDPLLDSLVYLTHSPLIPIARVAILDAFVMNPFLCPRDRRRSFSSPSQLLAELC